MKRFLLASVAAVSLAAAIPAFAQTSDPLPATPPIVAPALAPDATTEENAEVDAQSPIVEGGIEVQAEAQTTVEPPAVTAQTGESQAQTTAPDAGATTEQSAQAVAPAAPTVQGEPGATVEAQTETEAPEAVTAQTEAAAETAAAGGLTPTPVSASAVCEPRTTSVHFGVRGSALSQQNRNAIEYAIDAASVCDLQQVTIADSADGAISSRRASAVRAALVRQGIPEERITVAEAARADAEAASTGRLDVLMTFAGVADAGTPVASLEAAPATAAPQGETETETQVEEQPST